jgi:hypothetical protein
LGYSKGIAKRKVYSAEHLAHMKKIREISNNLMLHLKLLEKQEQANSKSCRWKEIVKIGAEIGGMETKKHTKNQ